MLKRILPLIFTVCALFLLFCPAANAADEAQQVELSATCTGFDYASFLTDGKDQVYLTAWNGSTIDLSSDTPFSSLYLMFNLEYGEYTITDNISGQTVTAGQHGFLHEFVRLPQETTSVTILFPSGIVTLSEIRAYTGGTPKDAQIWDPPHEGNTDLLLMSTHGDDEHLFFAGLLPIYAAEQDYNVQVVYFTNHREWTKERCHEMLNGLWAVGVRAYPVFGTFPDFRLDDRDATYAQYANLGVTKDEMLAYVVEQIRRFDPQVVVGHDFKGEYGHGMHQVYADLVSQAIYLTNDPNYFPQSAEQYGLWDVPKTYFHVYPENSIELELDDPLTSFNGMSAFDVSRNIGFPCHVSQQIYTTFTHWVYGPNNEITCSKDIVNYSPRFYGLYRTTVGPDVAKDSLMENTARYNERKRQEEERIAQEEAARLEAERLEAERLAQEEAVRQAEEAKRLEEKRRKEEAEAHRQEQQRLVIFLIIAGIVLLLIIAGSFLPKLLRKKDRSSEKPPVTDPPTAEAAEPPTKADGSESTEAQES